jgi:hypothetical protein
MTHHIAQIRQALLHLPHCTKESQRRLWLEGIRKATDAIQEEAARMERSTARLGERIRDLEAMQDVQMRRIEALERACQAAGIKGIE